MNREILFRGKCVDNGEWVEGYVIETENPEYRMGIVRSISFETSRTHCDILDFDIVQIDPITLNRYTGLTDKNGRRIFEGDIVKNIDGIYVVEYCKSLTRFALAHDGLMSGRPVSSGTVIGNIHDNPEMMVGSENNP